MQKSILKIHEKSFCWASWSFSHFQVGTVFNRQLTSSRAVQNQSFNYIKQLREAKVFLVEVLNAKTQNFVGHGCR